MKKLSALLLGILLFLVPLAAASGDLIDINTGDSASLEQLSGIGPVKAKAIIEYRTENGPFATVDDIVNVRGIGPATLEKIRDQVTVGDSEPVAEGSSTTEGGND